MVMGLKFFLFDIGLVIWLLCFYFIGFVFLGFKYVNMKKILFIFYSLFYLNKLLGFNIDFFFV